jgi:hypothetical protein
MEYWAPILTEIFGTKRTAELSILRAGPTLPPRKFLSTHFCQRLRVLQGYWMWTEGTGHLRVCKGPSWKRNWNLPPCGAAPQPTACI